MSDEQARRAGLNEAVFRQVNEELEGLNRSFADLVGKMDLVCECGELACVERIELTVEEYEGVRADPLRFALVPGHEQPDVEDVVERHAGWLVVRKQRGIPERVAASTNPRA